MGIQGLLPLLKSIMSPIHIKELEGCCVAVDTYSWLHKGALSCSRELCKGLPTSRHIEYCMHRVNLLRHYGVKPILVFDGGLLPMKMEQENKRARSRKENLARAIEHESNGNSCAAYECYQKAVDISPSIALDLIQVLKRENVSYVVAPYEADAQMTFLAITNQVDAVITEDSDLIPFGCPRIIFKMDKFGHSVEFQASMLHKNKELSFAGFSKQMILEMCILSGCDYLQSLSGMGLKRAHALIARFKSYDRVIKHLKYSMVSVPPLYEESFKKAILTFKHQRVYDPKTEDIVHLSDISDNLCCESDFLGPLIAQQVAKGIAEGDIDPFTSMPFQGENVGSKLMVNSHPKNFEPERLKKKLELPVQKNLLTKYFCFASLEAKRKFRAPRISPNCQSLTADDSSSTPEEQECMDAASAEADNSLASSSHSPNSDNVYPTSNLGEKGSATRTLEIAESAIHDSLGRSDKEVGGMNFGEAERITKESAKVIVRSKYFQQKHTSKSFQDKKGENPCPKDCCVIGKNCDYKTLIRESGASGGKQGRKKPSEDHEDDIYENLLTMNNDFTDGYKNVNENFVGTTKMESEKVVVRSKYFQLKPVSRSHLSDEGENLLVKDDSAIETPENVVPWVVSPGKRYFEGTTGKRKSSLDDSFQKENLNPKHMRKDKTSHETNSDTKFGSNISHISRYSEIAEKSVERFVSAISSFRYSSSGSRVSGLRAPLKSIRNSSNGSSLKPDFSKFAYVPTNRDTAARSRRL